MISLNEYKKLVKDAKGLGSSLLPGHFYSFEYDYRSSGDDLRKAGRVVETYDVMPLVYVLELRGKTFLGINLHRLDNKYREWWLNKLKSFTRSSFENNSRIIIPSEVILKIDSKINYAVRSYSINKIRNTNLIPNGKILELSKHTPRSFDTKSIGSIHQEFKQFIP